MYINTAQGKELYTLSSISIVLADDNPTFLRYLIPYLERQDNFRIAGTASTGDGLLILAFEKAPDVIVTDLRMPGLGGVDLIGKLRSLMPRAGIVALSFQDVRSASEAVLSAGADRYVSKTDTIAELPVAIRQAALLVHQRAA